MKKLKTWSSIALVAILLSYSCNDNNISSAITRTKTKTKDSKDIILKERDPNLPLILSKKRKLMPTLETRSGDEPFFSFLGRSLKIKRSPLTDYRNFGWKVIDMNLYLKDNPNCYYSDPIGTSDGDSFAYSSFDRYLEKSTINKKINRGFSLNLGLFSIGHKRVMEQTFSKAEINEKKRVFGEAYYLYLGSRYHLKGSSNDIKNMKNYLAKGFTDDIYNIPINEFLELYGEFVLCDFIVGGKAFAVYSGYYAREDKLSTKEKNTKKDINASFGFPDVLNDTLKGSVGFGFGKGYSNGKESSNKVTDLKVSIKTLGGVGAIANLTNPENVNNINFNLSSWLSSLLNEKTHRIVEISNKGLLPITEFIREKNLKELTKMSIENMSRRGDYLNFKFEEPTISYAHISMLNWDVLFLKTRYGNIIQLYSKSHVGKKNAQAIIAKYNSIYKLKTIDVSQRANDIVAEADPLDGTHDPYSDGVHPTIEYLIESVFDMDTEYIGGSEINEEINMRKFTYNNITYLIPQKEGLKFGYTIHDDYILDTYGIRDWVNKMPTTKLTMHQLSSYTLIAL